MQTGQTPDLHRAMDQQTIKSRALGEQHQHSWYYRGERKQSSISAVSQFWQRQMHSAVSL